MAAEEGAVIACHTKDEFDARMAKAKEQGKLVRTHTSSHHRHLLHILLL